MLWGVEAAFVTQLFDVNVFDICNFIPIQCHHVASLACNCDCDTDTNHKRANFLKFDFVKAFDVYQLHVSNMFLINPTG